ncbi:hypothetical protein ABZ897_62150 [Nonomuraea sp. NPDC046802]|uniref:hypothetical protein n=1 Tax=Nonomuraea sp. NPDC046802 TaxID=3154919 RepID=UPI0034115B93
MAGYGVLRRPAAATLLGYLVVGRLAGAAFPIAFVIVLAATRGYAQAALLQGVLVAALAGSAPFRARVLDRVGTRRALLPQCVISTVATVALAVCAGQPHVSGAVIALLTLVVALSTPALDAAVRTSWRRTATSDAEVKALHALDSIIEEAGFLAGPPLAATLMLTLDVQTGIIVIAALMRAITLLTVLTPVVRRTLLADRPPTASTDPASPTTSIAPAASGPQKPGRTGRCTRLLSHLLGPIAQPQLRRIVTPIVVMGTSFGFLGIALPALAAGSGAIAASGFITAAISLGGLIGGLAYGGLKLTGSLWRRHAVISLVFGLPVIALLVARSPWSVAAILVIAGLAVTPLYINSYLLIDQELPDTVKHEANTWVAVGNDLGYIIGISTGGILLTSRHDYDAALAGAALTGLLLVAVAIRALMRTGHTTQSAPAADTAPPRQAADQEDATT